MSIFHQHVDLLLALPMCTFTENPCARMRIPCQVLIKEQQRTREETSDRIAGIRVLR